MSRVLVAYATKYGSTKGVAEAVAASLNERGIDADVAPAGDVKSLDGYSAVVLGVALYFFRWHSAATRFVSRHRKALEGMPVAVFGLGPIEDKPEQFEGARTHLDKGLAKAPWFSPRAVAIFGGAVDPAELRFPDNNPAFRAMPVSDLRDWDAIRVWAESLPDALGLDDAGATA
jgi:menaquinone-dependent protoporphyrinogen oxidase